jgi:predicted deacylase
MTTIRVRDLEAAPGAKIYGGITCGEWADGSPIKVPLVIVNGRQPGPTLVAIGGMHGDEMVGTEAVRRIAAELDPARMRGAVIGVVAANVVAFLLGSRVNTLEDPGGWNDFEYVMQTAQPTGSLTERLGCLLRDEIVPQCQYYIDLHSSAKGSTNYPRAIVAGEFVPMAKDLREKIDRIAEACGFEYIFRPKLSSWPGMYFAPDFPLEERYGLAGICLETGHAPTFEGIDTMVKGVRNILIEVGILEGRMERDGAPTYIERLVAVRANRGGIWLPKVWIPHAARAGEQLGTITNLASEVVEDIRAPMAGVAIKVATSAAVATGTRVFVLGIPYA